MRPLLTLTGVDRATSTKWMNSLLQKYFRQDGYGAIEFAILRSPKIDQSPRYVDRATVSRITHAVRASRLAFHLCGRYARMVHSGDWAELCDIIDFDQVARVQVNSPLDTAEAMMRLLRFSEHIEKPLIMQWRGDIFPSAPGLHLLQDRSGGRGVTESNWSIPDGYCVRSKRTLIGYAGGLSPENVGAALSGIKAACRRKPFWIDCESSLRTDDWFDEMKAEAMAAAVHAAIPELFMKVDES